MAGLGHGPFRLRHGLGPLGTKTGAGPDQRGKVVQRSHRGVQQQQGRMADRCRHAGKESGEVAEAGGQGEGGGGIGAGEGQQGQEGVAGVLDPERRVTSPWVFVFEAELLDPEVLEEGGAVDFRAGVGHIELLHRAGNGAERRDVGPDGIGIKGAEPGIVSGHAGPGGGGGVEVPAEIEKRLAEVVGAGH